MTRQPALWIALALFGIAGTVAVAWFASGLTGQRIGLSSEPLSVAARLAPGPAKGLAHPATPTHRGRSHRSAASPPPSRVTVPSTSAPPPAPASTPPTTTAHPAPATAAPVRPPVRSPSPPPASQASGGQDSGGGRSSDSNSGPDD